MRCQRHSDAGALKDDSVPRYVVTNLCGEDRGNLCLDRIEIEVYEKNSVSDEIMLVSEKLYFRGRDNQTVDLALGIPYVHSLWVHSDKLIYTLVTAKLFVLHEGYSTSLSIPLELSTMCKGSYEQFDIRKGE